jgi:ketosteroid isomerase-like protein
LFGFWDKIERGAAMRNEDDRLKAAQALLKAIEQGDGAALLAAYAKNAVQIEHPNRLKPKGDRRAPARMVEDLARGKKMLRSERYDVLEATVMGDQVALQVRWTGVVDVPVGALRPGDSMLCESAIFLKFQGDKIVEQHNYDCFEDFLTPRT